MDKSAASAYVYAKVCGMLAKSYVGERVAKLFSVKSLNAMLIVAKSVDNFSSASSKIFSTSAIVIGRCVQSVRISIRRLMCVPRRFSLSATVNRICAATCRVLPPSATKNGRCTFVTPVFCILMPRPSGWFCTSVIFSLRFVLSFCT